MPAVIVVVATLLAWLASIAVRRAGCASLGFTLPVTPDLIRVTCFAGTKFR